MTSELERILAFHIRAKGLPEPRTEFLAIPGRKFRYDAAWVNPAPGIHIYGPGKGLLVECNGATWVEGGHSTGYGIRRDYEKMILAQLNGWRIFMFTRDQIESGKAIQWIEQALKQPEV